MRICRIHDKSKQQLRLTELLTTRAEAEENFHFKGFHLCIGIAEDCDYPEKRYFLKFFILNGDEKELATARFALASEWKFQVRHPNVVYVEFLSEAELRLESADREQDPYGWICEVMDRKGTDTLKILCLAEEYADGWELGEYYREDKEPVSEDEMFCHMHQLLDGMCGYYGRYRKDPLLHRDIKPSNLVIRKKDHKLVYIDFDLSHSSGSTRTQTGKRLLGGTPGYADPRQYEMVVRKSDVRMDIYALGMVFLYMMTGSHYVQTNTKLSDEEMAAWKYLEKEEYLEYVYHVKKAYLRRRRIPVFQDKRYDRLLTMIGRMIHWNLETDMDSSDCRYMTPMDVLQEFEGCIRELYGEKAEEILKNDQLLNADSPLLDKGSEKAYYVQFYSEKGQGKILTLRTNQVMTLQDEEGQFLLTLNATDKGVHYIRFVQNTVPVDDKGNRSGLLTKQGYHFNMYNNRYFIRMIDAD